MVRCSIEEAAKVLGISESAVRERIAAGILVAEQTGREWRVLLPRIVLDEQPDASSPIADVRMPPAEDAAERPLPLRDEASSPPPRPVHTPAGDPAAAEPAQLPDLDQVLARAGAGYIDTLRSVSADFVRRYGAAADADRAQVASPSHAEALGASEQEIRTGAPHEQPPPVQAEAKRVEVEQPEEAARDTAPEFVREVGAASVVAAPARSLAAPVREGVPTVEGEATPYAAAQVTLYAQAAEGASAEAVPGMIQDTVQDLAAKPAPLSSAARPRSIFIGVGPASSESDAAEPKSTPDPHSLLNADRAPSELLERDEHSGARLFVVALLILALLTVVLAIAIATVYLFNISRTPQSTERAVRSSQAAAEGSPNAQAATLAETGSTATMAANGDASAGPEVALIFGASVSSSPAAQAGSERAPSAASESRQPSAAVTAPSTSADQSASATGVIASPAASAPLAPTAEAAPSSPSAAASSSAPTAAALLAQVARAEAAVQSGEFEVTLDYGQGTRSSARVRFDLGDPQQPPRMALATTYLSAAGTATVERITIGDRAWERHGSASWGVVTEQTAVWDQIQSFLPLAASASSPELSADSTSAQLRWYDSSRGSDVTLLVDPASGTPRELRRVTRGTGSVLIVIYSGWNNAVEIQPPVQG